MDCGWRRTYLNKGIHAVPGRIEKETGKQIEYISFHGLRHTFATRCIENGMQPQVLKAILGYSKLSITMDLYAHVLPDEKTKEMQKIAELFSEKMKIAETSDFTAKKDHPRRIKIRG